MDHLPYSPTVLLSDACRTHAGMGHVKSAYKIVVRKPNRRDHMEDLSMDGKIILKWFLEL
jgi:hypothetical protein